MKTRFLCTITACLLGLAACGGGDSTSAPTQPTITAFSADSSSYWVGDKARLTVAFRNGTALLEPEGIAVTSGQTITTSMLSNPIQYRLVVTDGKSTVSRALNLDVRYRDRLRAVTMPFARGEHRAVRLPDGRVLIIGGEDDSSAFPPSVYAFHPDTESFTPFAQLSSGRTGFIAQSLNSGDVLVAGGSRALISGAEAEVIDHLTGTVTPTANEPQRHRRNAAATLLQDGKVFICGGLALTSNIDDSAEVYDPATRTFTLLPGRLQAARYSHTVVRIDQRRLLIYGGLTSNSQPLPPEIYDIVAGTSTALAAPETNVRSNHTAITLQDGGILLIGGEDYDDMPLASVLRFDPASSTFASYAMLATPRSATAIERLVDGRVFIAGGVTTQLSSDSTHTTELLTAAQRRDGPAMGVPRRDHTVTRLDSGKLLVVGGLGTNLWPLASAELYE